MASYDIEGFRTQVSSRLDGLSKEQLVRFAFMCSIRCFPFLCLDRRLPFWKKKRQIHLASVMHVHDICMSYFCGIKDSYIHVDAAINASAAANAAANATANAAAYDTYSLLDIYDAAFDTAKAAAAAAAASTATSALRAANTAASATIAASIVADKYKPLFKDQDIVISIGETILSDLDCIIANSNQSNFNNDTSIYDPFWNNFLNALKAIDCAYWAKQYELLFENHFVPDKEELALRLTVPDAIRAEGAAAIARHMESLARQGLTETKEARIILLGSKGAGKTSLSRKLHNSRAFMPRKSQSTPGVDTSKLKLIPGETTHLWDFGGHVVAQAAHKCFMSAECVYILVIDGRTEQQLDIDEHRKWLATVKTYSEGRAKVFVVVNTSDNHHRSMPENKLREEFPSLVEGFYSFNVKRDKPKLRSFRDDIKKYIETHFVRKLPSQYFNMKKELERQFKKLKKETLPEADVRKIAEGFSLEDDKQDALIYLNTLGVALRYDNIPDIVLNPTWISNGIYTIINYMQNNGDIEIHLEDMPKVFKGKEAWRYGTEKCELLYELMVKYELAFEMKDTKPNTLFVPSVLPYAEPDNPSAPGQDEETLVRRYGFDIALSDSVFPKYIQRNHIYLEQKNGTYIMWHGGMSLVGNEAYAKVTNDTRQIEITTWGANKSDFLYELHNRLLDLLQEHHLKWERDEIKLSTGFCATEVICQLHKDGTKEYGETQTDTILKTYHLSLVNIVKPEINTGLGILSAKASLSKF